MSRSLERLTTIWDERGISEADLVMDTDGTIGVGPPSTGPELPIPRLFAEGADEQLELGKTIGEGGMGIVRAATQLAIDRQVAVKCVRPDSVRAGAPRELVREARITGALEHPNIVPVHTLGLDEHGNPMIVMKRIDGSVWSPPSRDLDANIDVLLDVCRAVHFAHSNAIIHRDLKPENVMIGSFGEVYVLDWGLSVTTDPEQRGRLPLASEVRSVAGTPHYMAPEMAAGNGRRIGPHSDVYLLGAILHECITGQTRHRGDSVVEMLQAAFESVPVTWPDDVPAELGAICNRATHVDSEQRYESAEAFRLALLDYREHRGSARLAAEATHHLRDLRAASAAHDLDPARVRELFGACRFAYQQSLRTWPDNREASDGLEEALGLMARVELDLDHPGAAGALIGEMRAPPEALAARLAAAQERLAKLEQLDRELDTGPGRRARMATALVLGGVFAAISFWLGDAHRSGDLAPSLGIFACIALLFVAIIEIAARVAGDAMRETQLNRQFLAANRILGASMLLLAAGTALLGTDSINMILIVLVIVAVTFSLLAATVEPKLWWAAGTFAVAFLAGCAFPDFALEAQGLGVLLGSLAVAGAWADLTCPMDRDDP